MKHKVVYNSCYGGFGLSDLAKVMLREMGWAEEQIDSVCFDQTIRSHPDLVKVVETLGSAANGRCADLSVTEIPGTQYRIGEYDGTEWVETPETINWTTAYGCEENGNA